MRSLSVLAGPGPLLALPGLLAGLDVRAGGAAWHELSQFRSSKEFPNGAPVSTRFPLKGSF